LKRSILATLLVLAFAAVGIAAAPSLTFTFSNVQANKTAMWTDTYAVNNAGVITGDYVDAKGVQHGMILTGKKLTTVDYKNCAASTLSFYGINSAGTVVGFCGDAKTEVPVGYSYAAGKFTAINFPKGTGTQAMGINDKGDIVGLYFDTAGAQHGFSKIGKKYTSIDVKNETSAAAWGINNAGQITVYAVNSIGNYDSFLKTGTKFKKISDPKATGVGTVVHTVNNKGDIAGTYYNSDRTIHGWLLHDGKYYDIDDPKGSALTRTYGLNDKLEIVGRYSPSSGGNVGFKATTKQ